MERQRILHEIASLQIEIAESKKKKSSFITDNLKINLQELQSTLQIITNKPDDGRTSEAQILCPGKGSSLFVPGAVAPEVTVDLRNKIARIQAPPKGARVLSAKTYLSLVGAYLG